MRPFWKFYGGKWRAAPRYPRPLHSTIVEPFAGAAGYSTRYYQRDIILVEKDPRIAALWRYLISVSRREILELPDRVQCVDEVKGPQEARDLVGFWLNVASARPSKSLSAWSEDGRANYWSPKAKARIARQVEHIKHWQILEGDWSEAPDIKATWFIDPPYQDKGRFYRCSSKEIDFASLGQWSRQRQGQVIVCEGPGANWLPFRYLFDQNTARSQSGQSVKRAELVWTQGCVIQGSLFEVANGL